MFPKFSDAQTLSDFVGDLRHLVFPFQTQAEKYLGLNRTTIGRYESDHIPPPRGYVALLARLYAEKRKQTANAAWQAAFLHEINLALVLANLEKFKSWAELAESANQFQTDTARRSRARRAAATTSASAGVKAKGAYLPQPRYVNLFGRARELARILKLLTARMTPPIIVIHGPPGNGKTALAREIAERVLARAEWTDVLWISAESAGNDATRAHLTFEQVLDQVITQTGAPIQLTLAPPEQRRRLRAHLRQYKYLIVLDNLEESANEQEILRQLYELIGNSRIVATTRSHATYPMGMAYAFELSGLDARGVKNYLTRQINARGHLGANYLEKSVIEQIHAATWGSPLLLDWFLMDLQSVSFKRALANLPVKLSAYSDSRARAYTHYLQTRWHALSLHARQLWYYFAIGVPATLGQTQLQVLAPLESRALEPALGELIRAGILESTWNAAEGEYRLSQHPLMKRFIVEGATVTGDKPRWAKLSYRKALTASAKGWSELCQANPRILNTLDERRNFMHLAHQCAQYGEFQAVLLIYEPSTTNLHEMGFLNEYVEFQTICLQAAQRLGALKIAAQIESELGWHEMSLKRWAQAEAYIKSALAYFRGARDVWWTFVLRRYLATIELERGNFHAAREQFETLLAQAQKYIRQSGGAPRQKWERQASVLHDGLGNTLAGLKMYKQSERELLRGLETIAAGDDFAIATELVTLGKMYLQWQKWREAKQYLEDALQVSRARHFHSLSGDALTQLSLWAEQQNNLAAARQYARQAHQVYQNLRDLGNFEQLDARLRQLRRRAR